MRIHIDTKSDVPVYRQLMEQVQAQIALGHLHLGDRLPSVRELAVDLHLNPNTVARAYRDLGQLGVVETRGSMGTFVRAGQDMPGREVREEDYRRRLRTAIAMAHSLGVEAERAREIIAEETEQVFSREGESLVARGTGR